MVIEERSNSYERYRFGFQGQEHDDQIKGKGNSISYKYRMHDPRLGRFFAVDPLETKYPYNSPYAFSENVVIHAIELEGLEMLVVHGVMADAERNSDPLTQELRDMYRQKAGYSENQVNNSFDWSGRMSGESGDVNFFRRQNHLFPRKSILRNASDALVKHTLETRQNMINECLIEEGSPITFLAFSGGGPSAILAAKKLSAKGYTVNVITHNAPAAKKGEFHPSGGGINDATFVYTKGDAVSGRWFNGFKSKFKNGSIPQEFQQVRDVSTYDKKGIFAPLKRHSADYSNVEGLRETIEPLSRNTNQPDYSSE